MLAPHTDGDIVESWQLSLAIFLVLAPVVLMIATWGDERLSFRGRPVQRDWQTQVEHAPGEQH